MTGVNVSKGRSTIWNKLNIDVLGVQNKHS